MNQKKQLAKAFFISLLFLIAFGLIVLLIGNKKISNFDTRIISYIHDNNSAFLTSIMKFFTFIGSGVVITIIVVLMMLFFYFVLKHRSELVLFAGVLIGSALLNVLLKLVFHRARPILNRIIDENGYSFPSGHSMAAFTLYGILTFLLWRHLPSYWSRSLLIICSAFMIIMIGISRIYLGVHYPSDVLGGFLISGAWLFFTISIYQRHQGKK
jgi:undecaprenyl-diphosphatase